MLTKDYSNKDYDSIKESMLAELKKRLPEYTDTSENDFGIVLLELFASGVDVLSFYQDIMHNEAFIATAEQKESVLRWCKTLGYVPKTCTPAKLKQLFVRAFDTESDFIIPRGTIVKSRDNTVSYEVESDFTIPKNCWGDEKDSSGNYLYLANLVQGTSIQGEYVGESSGAPSQSFKLANDYSIIDTLNIYTIVNGEVQVWSRVDSFIDSTVSDTHYVAERDINGETYIVFGDGSTGSIPTKSLSIYASYRVCKGSKGDVAPNTITQCMDFAELRYTTNPFVPYELGSDDELIRDTKKLAPAYYRTMWRAVTYQDYVDLVKTHFKQILFASAIPDPTNKDKVIVNILSDGSVTLTKTINSITEFLDSRRIIGTDFEVVNYQSKPMNIQAVLLVKPEYLNSEVESNVKNFLTKRFELGKIDFGEELSMSMLSAEVITSVEGVKGFRFVLPDTDTVTSNKNEIFTLGTINLTVTGGIQS